jgi:hypothetical protein
MDLPACRRDADEVRPGDHRLGAAAFAAAVTARDRGASVLMIERGTVGGTCVNTGCVPSKALLAAAGARHVAADQRFPGIATQTGPVDMAALTGGKDDLVAGMRAAKYVDLAAIYGWEILAGTARFRGGTDAPALEVTLSDGGTTTVEAAHHLVATRSAPWIPPIDGLEQAGYLTSTAAMELTKRPESMLVIGGNSVGLELGQLFARLGVRVTIAEAPGPARPVRRTGGLGRDRGRLRRRRHRHPHRRDCHVGAAHSHRPFGSNEDRSRPGTGAGVRRNPGRGRPPSRHRRAEPPGRRGQDRRARRDCHR